MIGGSGGAGGGVGGGSGGPGGSTTFGPGGGYSVCSAVKSSRQPAGAPAGLGQTPRMTVPLSERQQLALLMQMTADEHPTSTGQSVASPALLLEL